MDRHKRSRCIIIVALWTSLFTPPYAWVCEAGTDYPPKAPVLTAARRDRLKEPGRLEEQVQKLVAEMRYVERIDDAATSALMTRFYSNPWERELPPLEAIRQAQLGLLDDPNFGDGGNPRLLAAWTLSGDPGGLPKLDSPAGPAPEVKK